MSQEKLPSIAICGTRGVPARYGGFETFAEQLGERLAAKGYKVVVYGRYYKGQFDRSLYPESLKGMELRFLPAVRHKYFETPLHTFLSFLHLYRRPVDVVLLCNAANSLFAWMPFLGGMPVIINLDGIERNRRKWNMLGKAWYYLGELSSSLFGKELISDATYIRSYYQDRYARDSSVIRYGARILNQEEADAKIKDDFSFLNSEEVQYLQGLKLEPGKYLLYVSRLEPENNADKVIAAYMSMSEAIKKLYPLVIVGDAPYSTAYKESLYVHASDSLRFLGFRFEKEYETLQKGAKLYFQATEVGGTHPALVEAMGYANCIVANEVPEHREVIDDVSVFYEKNDVADLSKKLSILLADPESILHLRRVAFERAQREFSWDAICEQYEELFSKVCIKD